MLPVNPGDLFTTQYRDPEIISMRGMVISVKERKIKIRWYSSGKEFEQTHGLTEITLYCDTTNFSEHWTHFPVDKVHSQ